MNHTPCPTCGLLKPDTSCPDCQGENKMNHTPGPWKIVTYNNGKGMAIEDEKGNDVLTKSNAQFIVTACNAHEALVTELKRTLMNVQAPHAADWEIVAARIIYTLTTIEKGS